MRGTSAPPGRTNISTGVAPTYQMVVHRSAPACQVGGCVGATCTDGTLSAAGTDVPDGGTSVSGTSVPPGKLHVSAGRTDIPDGGTPSVKRGKQEGLSLARAPLQAAVPGVTERETEIILQNLKSRVARSPLGILRREIATACARLVDEARRQPPSIARPAAPGRRRAASATNGPGSGLTAIGTQPGELPGVWAPGPWQWQSARRSAPAGRPAVSPARRRPNRPTPTTTRTIGRPKRQQSG